MEKVCCNPFNDHKEQLKVTKRNEKSFRVVTVDLARNSPVPLAVGAFICNHCRGRLSDARKQSTNHDDGNGSEIKR